MVVLMLTIEMRVYEFLGKIFDVFQSGYPWQSTVDNIDIHKANVTFTRLMFTSVKNMVR